MGLINILIIGAYIIDTNCNVYQQQLCNFLKYQHRNEKKPDAQVLSIQTLLIVTVFVFVIESNIYIVIAIKRP